MIRLQDKTPEVYSAESRDFQLFCRLYDCVVNGIKFDIDTIPDILDAQKCRSSMLALLQTKLGFFTNKKLNDDALRYVLTAFPMMVKNKGSLKAIKQAINIFFKVNGIDSEVQVWLVSEPTTMFGTQINDHTIVVSINSPVKDVSLLEEIFRYILPTGFGYYFSFYNQFDTIDTYGQSDEATLLLVSNNVNQIRESGSIIKSGNSVLNRLWGAVDTVYLSGDESVIATLNGTYKAGDDSKFLGVCNSFDDIKVTPKHEDCVIVNNTQYMYQKANEKPYNSTTDRWQILTFRGIQQNLEIIDNVVDYDVVCIPIEKTYYAYRNGNPVKLTYRGVYEGTNDVTLTQENDFIKTPTGEFWVKSSTNWDRYYFLENVIKLPKDDEIKAKTVYYLDEYRYYMYYANKWNQTDIPIYLLQIKTKDEIQ